MKFDQELPGMLEAVEKARPKRHKSGLSLATAASIQALDNERLLEPRHQALVALALDLAETIDAVRATANPRASAIAMLVKEYRETIAALPAPVVEGQSKLASFLAHMAEARESATP